MTQTGTARRGRVRVEKGRKRVRAFFGGVAIADTTRPLLVWEKPYYPTYYVPAADVRTDLLRPTGETHHSPSRGDAPLLDVVVDGRTAEGAAARYDDTPIEALRDTVRLDWAAMDAWFEEDEEVIVHPRDPHTRVDTLQSSRHVRIEVDGVTVAESNRPTVLFETGLPPRWYVPQTDVRLDLLRPTDFETQCPYKGTARYWSVDTGDGVTENVAWSYQAPLPESQKIAGLIAFFDERVDVIVDGVKQERPRTVFS